VVNVPYLSEDSLGDGRVLDTIDVEGLKLDKSNEAIKSACDAPGNETFGNGVTRLLEAKDDEGLGLGKYPDLNRDVVDIEHDASDDSLGDGRVLDAIDVEGLKLDNLKYVCLLSNEAINSARDAPGNETFGNGVSFSVEAIDGLGFGN